MSMYDTAQPAPKPVYGPEQEHVVEAGKVRAGDELVLESGQVRTVESVRTNAVGRIAISLAENKNEATFDQADELTVVRSAETDESKAARKEHQAEVAARGYLMTFGSKGDYEGAVAKLRAEEFPSGSAMEKVIRAQARWQTVAYVQDRFTNDYDGDYTSWVELLRHLVKKAAEGLIDNHGAPTYSGGFSFGNAQRQAEQDVAREFVKGAGWSGVTPFDR